MNIIKLCMIALCLGLVTACGPMEGSGYYSDPTNSDMSFNFSLQSSAADYENVNYSVN